MQALRVAELLAGLSLVADVGMGLEPGEAGRAGLVAMELAALADAPDPSDVYYTALLQHVGCTAYAHEAARLLGGDKLAVKRAAVHTDFARPRDVMRTYLPNLAPSARLATRLAAASTAAVRGRQIVQRYSRANCEVAAHTANGSVSGPASWPGCSTCTSSGTATAVRAVCAARRSRGLRESRRSPRQGRCSMASADARPPSRRFRRRAGRALDPELVELLTRRDGAALGVLDSVDDPVAAIVGVEPEPGITFSAPQAVDRICRAFGEVVDIKTPLHHGHCTGVAALAAAAAERCGTRGGPDLPCRLVHDLGRASVANGVWERPGPLTWPEQERTRLHAYHSERVLVRCGPLAPIARLAGMHHERLDGSGYHRGTGASGLGPAERLLAAADVMHALTEHRAHRPARTAEAAAEVLVAEAAAARLDPDAVRAVVEAAGASARPVRAPRPAGLTERQVEVLRLVANGLSNPEIARRLIISRRTAERHVQDVYARIGVSSRAAAALYALEHDLLPKDG